MNEVAVQKGLLFERKSFDVIVIGLGPVAVRFIQQLVAKNKSLSIAVFGDEPWAPYNRVKLSSVISGEIKESSIYESYSLDSYPFVTVFGNNRVEFVDRYDSEIIDSHGERYKYNKLVFATGSRAHIPNIKNVELQNIFQFRDLNDAQSLMSRSVRTRKTVVIGGGLLGLEAAKAMQRFNTEVHVIEHDMWLMFRQLDSVASTYLEEYISTSGIKVHVGTRVKQILGDNNVEGVELGSGEVIEADTIILATGIIPNSELAFDAGLHIGRGIKVTDKLQTNDTDIYAIGECAEHDGKVYGLVGPGYDQAAVLASIISGNPSQYTGSITTAKLKVVGLSVYSTGDINEKSLLNDSYVFRDKSKGIYRKIILKNRRICGLLGVGEWPGIQRFQEAIGKNRYVWPLQISNFCSKGMLWNSNETEGVSDWPASATVCNCANVTRRDLDEAISRGACSVADLASATGASTVCGSCKDLLNDYVGDTSANVAIKGFKTLVTSSIIIAFVTLLFSFFLPVSYSTTVDQSWHIDILWRDNLYKQISGYSLLTLSVLISFISFRKRFSKMMKMWDFDNWRIFHVVAGLFVVIALLAHTGFRMGTHLNFYLMIIFSTLLLVGSVAGVAIGYAHAMPKRVVKQIRTYALWSHIILLWPLPVLLGFHILKSYYY